MHKYLALAALFLASPGAAQMLPPVDHSRMQGMRHDNMAGMNREGQAKPGTPMQPMDHSKMAEMGEMMKNTPANPYAEAGMAMHHKMMVVGADASETWVRKMIEHHRGAIAMSKIAVSQAADKDVRVMAQKVVAMQEKEVASLQSWLKRNGKKAQ